MHTCPFSEKAEASAVPDKGGVWTGILLRVPSSGSEGEGPQQHALTLQRYLADPRIHYMFCIYFHFTDVIDLAHR